MKHILDDTLYCGYHTHPEEWCVHFESPLRCLKFNEELIVTFAGIRKCRKCMNSKETK